MAKMSKADFISAMKGIGEQFGEVKIDEITRTDKCYTGMFINRVNVPTPIVNLDRMYSHYLETSDLESCIDAVRDILTMSPKFSVGDDTITNWEQAKTRLFLRLVGDVKNGYCQVIEDMYLVPYVQIMDGACTASVVITPDLLDCWGVTIDEVFDAASENQETLRPVVIKNLADILGLREEVPIYIVTTESKVCGAGAILYHGVAETLREKLGSDFYIIPSSIHETLVLPKESVTSVRDLAGLVAKVNIEDVPEDDKLTDSVYTYDFEEGKILKVI